MTFTFNTAIPAAANDPSVDQPDMLTNNISTDAILAVDHISFNTANGGQHKQLTLNNKNAAGAQTDPQSVLYSASGTASTVADMRFRNQNAIFPVNLVRGYGVFDTAGATVSSQSINLSCSGWGAGTGYVMAVPANVLTGSAYGVVAIARQDSLNPCWSICYAVASATAFNIGFRRSDTGAFGQPTNGFIALVYQL